MKHTKRMTIELPSDENGMLGRECPRCQGRFTVHGELFEKRGFLNLRCPYCEFIAEADQFLTGEQRAHVYSLQRDELLGLAENVMSEIVENAFSQSGFDLNLNNDLDLGNVHIESPHFTTETDSMRCDDCGFQYGVKVDKDSVCPVCR